MRISDWSSDVFFSDLTGVFSSASNVSTGLEMTRSRGSGVSMMGSRAMACRDELSGPPSTHRPSRPERLRQRPFVEIVELPPHRQAVRELGQPRPQREEGDMTTITEANKALVRRYLQAVIDGDVDTVEGVQHPDCKWWVVGQGDIDRETFNAMTRSGLLAAEKRTLEIISMTAEGDRKGGGSGKRGSERVDVGG